MTDQNLTPHEILARNRKWFQKHEKIKTKPPKSLYIFMIILYSFFLTVNSIGFGVGLTSIRVRNFAPSKVLSFMDSPVRCDPPYSLPLKALVPGYIAGCSLGTAMYNTP